MGACEEMWARKPHIDTAVLGRDVGVDALVLEDEGHAAGAGGPFVGVGRLERREDEFKADALERVVLVIELHDCECGVYAWVGVSVGGGWLEGVGWRERRGAGREWTCGAIAAARGAAFPVWLAHSCCLRCPNDADLRWVRRSAAHSNARRPSGS